MNEVDQAEYNTYSYNFHQIHVDYPKLLFLGSDS